MYGACCNEFDEVGFGGVKVDDGAGIHGGDDAVQVVSMVAMAREQLEATAAMLLERAAAKEKDPLVLKVLHTSERRHC
jgi:hypothetical protein